MGTETVLVVEDEPDVRAWVALALQQMGYAVVEAASPEIGLELAKSHPGPIHLLLTDVMMPRIIGPELAHLIVGARPGIKVLYMSGYADDSSFPPELREDGMVLLKKPFTASALACKVRKALET